MSHTKRTETVGEVTDMLPYQQNCALMALARTERMSSKQMLSSLKSDQGLESGTQLEYNSKLLEMMGKRGYTPVTKDFQSWDSVQAELKKMHGGSSGPKSTRYFALTYDPGKDPHSKSAIGHAVSLSVGRGGGVSVFGSNSDRDPHGKWIGGEAPHVAGGRPFQMGMKGDSHVQVFALPGKKK